jgi:hypothetical protein
MIVIGKEENEPGVFSVASTNASSGVNLRFHHREGNKHWLSHPR